MRPRSSAHLISSALSALAGLALLGSQEAGLARGTNEISETNAPVASKTELVSRSNTPPSVPRVDYSTFKLIGDRNIFNPNRSSRSAASRGESRKPSRSDSFSLVGIMSYEKGDLAFFDGSGSEYKKVVKLEESIAGYRVTSITPTLIKLSKGEKAYELTVGAQMRRQEDSDWELVTSGSKSAAAATPKAGDSGEDEKKMEDASGGDASEVLKRLLQKREKELNHEKP